MTDKGSYTVDEIEHSGTPDKLTIRARSADLRAGLTQPRERSFHLHTLGDIVRSIAKQNDLTPAISDALETEAIDHLDQTNESDANLLTRLAEQFGAVATVKQGQLLFIKAGDARSASGRPLPPVTITRQHGDSHRFNIADREAYTGVKAYDQNTRKAEQQTVEVKKQKPRNKPTQPDKGEALADGTDNVKVLRHVYASKTNAERGAKAAWEKLQRGVAEFSITLAHGRPELFPELPVTVQGFKPVIDHAQWIISRVTHSLGDGGYTMGVELEVRVAGFGEGSTE